MIFSRSLSTPIVVSVSLILAIGLITGCDGDIVSPELPSELAQRREAGALPDSIPVTVELDMPNALRVGETVVAHPKLVNEGDETLPVVHAIGSFRVYIYRNEQIVYPKRERVLFNCSCTPRS